MSGGKSDREGEEIRGGTTEGPDDRAVEGKTTWPGAANWMKQAGYDSPGLSTESRKLVFDCAGNDARFLIVRPTDADLCRHGAADVGVVGKDVAGTGSDVYEPLDLKVGACRISVAALQGQPSPDRWSSKIRVATKYPNVTERYFNQRGCRSRLSNCMGQSNWLPWSVWPIASLIWIETGNLEGP